MTGCYFKRKAGSGLIFKKNQCNALVAKRLFKRRGAGNQLFLKQGGHVEKHCNVIGRYIA